MSLGNMDGKTLKKKLKTGVVLYLLALSFWSCGDLSEVDRKGIETSNDQYSYCTEEESLFSKVLYRLYPSYQYTNPYVNCTSSLEDGNAPRVVAFPAGGTFDTNVEVRFLTDEDSQVFYTLDGTDPDETSAVYAGGVINIASDTELHFFAEDTSGNSTDIYVNQYSIVSGNVQLNVDSIKTYFDDVETFLAGENANAVIAYSGYTGGALSVYSSLANSTGSERELISSIDSPGATGTIEVPSGSLGSGINHIFLVPSGEGGVEVIVDVFKDEKYPLLYFSDVGGWYNATVDLDLVANEAAKIYYYDNSAPSSVYELTSNLLLNTTRTLTFWAVDYAGNKGPEYTQDYQFDFSAPVVTLTSAVEEVISGNTGAVNDAVFTAVSDQDGTIQVERGGSQPGEGEVIIENETAVAGVEFSVTIASSYVLDGSNDIYIYVIDQAGNFGVASAAIYQDSLARIPLPVYPANNESYIKYGGALSFRWSDSGSAADEYAGFKEYHLQLSSDEAFGTYTEYVSLVNQYDVPEADLSGTMYWRVLLVDNIDNVSDFSPVQRVRVDQAKNDVNGDGYSDLLIGIPFYDSPERGRVELYFGDSGGVIQALIIDADSDETRFGNSVDISEDLNGDGFADLVIGEPDVSPGSKLKAGTVHVFFGGSTLDAKCGGFGSLPCTLTASDSDLQIDGSGAGDALGTYVKDIGDLDGDWQSDLIVSAPKSDSYTGTDVGEIRLLLGKSSGFTSTADYTVKSVYPSSGFGSSVSIQYRSVLDAGEPGSE